MIRFLLDKLKVLFKKKHKSLLDEAQLNIFYGISKIKHNGIIHKRILAIEMEHVQRYIMNCPVGENLLYLYIYSTMNKNIEPLGDLRIYCKKKRAVFYSTKIVNGHYNKKENMFCYKLEVKPDRKRLLNKNYGYIYVKKENK